MGHIQKMKSLNIKSSAEQITPGGTADQSEISQGKPEEQAAAGAVYLVNTRWPSCGSDYVLKKNLESIAEQEDIAKKQRAFIAKHSAVLAGLEWSVTCVWPEIDIDPTHYRGKETTAQEIAAIWPGLAWAWAENRYDSSEICDWIATIDGITLRLRDAGKVDRPRHTNGEPIAIAKAEGRP